MQWIIKQRFDVDMFWRENEPNNPEGIGVSGTFVPKIKDATVFTDDQRFEYISTNGKLPDQLFWTVIPMRWKNAIEIQSAVNPAGIANALHSAFCEVIAEGGDTMSQRNDPACRLILHQLAYLLDLRGGYDLADFMQYEDACREKAKSIY